MKGFFESELGKVYIDPSIITRLCVMPEMALSDVFVLPNGPVSNEPSEMVNRKGVDRYIHVEFNADGLVIVDLRLMVKYGPSIRSSAALFQEKILRRIEAITGLKVAKIDIKIDGIFRPPSQASLPPPSDAKAIAFEEGADSAS